MKPKKSVEKPVAKKEVKSVKKTTKLVIEGKKNKNVKEPKIKTFGVKSAKKDVKTLKTKATKPNLKEILALGVCLLGLLSVMAADIKSNKTIIKKCKNKAKAKIKQ